MKKKPLKEKSAVDEQSTVQQKDDFDEWHTGKWCKVCSLTIGMAKLGLCDWQKKLRAQGKECPKLLPPGTSETI
jgi:hypothetical protein